MYVNAASEFVDVRARRHAQLSQNQPWFPNAFIGVQQVLQALPIHPGTLKNTAARSPPEQKLSFISYKASLHSGS
ncbi:hypothetical protein FJTKL_04294 [Diaporthe vaccinii]|uniref:Uncharacterized protein n=1 Tax=Diaporthe vaccinii TaxID=105482 RepID=A0ABR4F0J1_9PEZI